MSGGCENLVKVCTVPINLDFQDPQSIVIRGTSDAACSACAASSVCSVAEKQKCTDKLLERVGVMNVAGATKRISMNGMAGLDSVTVTID